MSCNVVALRSGLLAPVEQLVGIVFAAIGWEDLTNK